MKSLLFYIAVAILGITVNVAANAMKFVVADDGPVNAYFAGGSASYTSYMSTIIGGVTRFEGFNNQTSDIGDFRSYGEHKAGTNVEAVLYNLSTNDIWYSDISKNSDGFNHVFASQFNLPGGGSAVFVGFEDIRGLGDRDFNDNSMIFTNIEIAPIPEPSTYLMLLAGLMLVYLSRKRGIGGSGIRPN